MRSNNQVLINATDNIDVQNSITLDTGYLVRASFLCKFGDATVNGNFVVEACNDTKNPDTEISPNWQALSSQVITNGIVSPILIDPCCYRWMRASFQSSNGVEQITTIADTGAVEIQAVTVVADTGVYQNDLITFVNDTGPVQSTYVKFSGFDLGLTVHNFYIWWDVNNAGVDPGPFAGYTAIKVDLPASSTASAICSATTAGIIASPANSFVSTLITGGVNLTIVQQFYGAITHASNGTGGGASPFSVSTPIPGVNSNLNNKYFTFASRTLSGSTDQGYAWYDIGGQGTAPSFIPGTAYAILSLAGSTQAQIATDTQSGIDDPNLTVTHNTTSVTLTGKYTGSVTAAANGSPSPGFSYGVSQAGALTNLLNKYFFINQVDTPNITYTAYLSPNSQGTDPLVPGTTGVPVVFNYGSTATAVATGLNTALTGAGFTVSQLTNVLTVTQPSSGAFTPALDHNTGFGFALVSGGTSTVLVTMEALGI